MKKKIIILVLLTVSLLSGCVEETKTKNNIEMIEESYIFHNITGLMRDVQYFPSDYQWDVEKRNKTGMEFLAIGSYVEDTLSFYSDGNGSKWIWFDGRINISTSIDIIAVDVSYISIGDSNYFINSTLYPKPKGAYYFLYHGLDGVDISTYTPPENNGTFDLDKLDSNETFSINLTGEQIDTLLVTCSLTLQNQYINDNFYDEVVNVKNRLKRQI